MEKLRFAVLAVLIGLASCEKNEIEVEDAKYFTLDANGLLSGAETFYLGKDSSKMVGYYYVQDIILEPFVISHSFNDWGFGEGFTYTNCTDDSTAYYTNLSGITAKGVKGDTYLIANAGEFNTTPTEISFRDSMAYEAVECYVTNSTYAFLSMLNGDDYSKKFTDKDWFRLTVTGYNGTAKTGHVDFLLADGTKIVSDWQKVDLSPLGLVTSIVFTLSSSDTGQWGMNTPSYFCLDQLKVRK